MKTVVKSNGRYGRLVFENSCMKSVWHVTLANGVRVLEHSGTVRIPYAGGSDLITRSTLRETTVTPEHAFQELDELTIEEEIRLDAAIEAEGARYRPVEEKVDDELEAGTFKEKEATFKPYSKWTRCEDQMHRGCLSDFWKMTE